MGVSLRRIMRSRRKGKGRAQRSALSVMIIVVMLGLPTVVILPVPAAGETSIAAVASLPTRTGDASAVWDGENAYIFGGLSAESPSARLNQIVQYNPVSNIATTVAALPSPRSLTSAVWDGSNAYIFGGLSGFGTALNQIVRYNPLTNTVTTMGATLPTARWATTSVWDGAHAYIFGGYAPGAATGQIVRYNPADDTVTTMGAVLPGARVAAGVVWDGSDIYLFGGGTGVTGGYWDQIVRYSPTTDTVSTMGAKLPSARYTATAAWDGSNAYIIGGYDGSYLSQIVRYTPATDSVSIMNAQLPTGRSSPSAVWDGSHVYVFGGWDVAYLTDIVRYDPGSDFSNVRLMSPLPFARRQASAIWDGSNGYVFGGIVGTTPTDQIVRYNPHTNAVAVMAAKLPSARYGTSAVWDGSNAYIFGGYSGTAHLDQIVRYHPATDTITLMSVALPGGRYATSAIWDGTNAYIFGGNDEQNDVRKTIFRYNPDANLVATLAQTLPSPRVHTSAVWAGSSAYIFGGWTGIVWKDEIVRFRPSTNSVTVADAVLPSVRDGTSAVWDGQDAYVFGGDSSNDGSHRKDEIVRYDPVADVAVALGAVLPTGRWGTTAIWDGASAHVVGGKSSADLPQIVRFNPSGDEIETIPCVPGTPQEPAMTVLQNPLHGRPGQLLTSRISFTSDRQATYTLDATISGGDPGWITSFQGAQVRTCPGTVVTREFSVLVPPSAATKGATISIAPTPSDGGLPPFVEQRVVVRNPAYSPIFSSRVTSNGALEVSAYVLDARTGQYVSQATVLNEGFSLSVRLTDGAAAIATSDLVARPDDPNHLEFIGAVAPGILVQGRDYLLTVVLRSGDDREVTANRHIYAPGPGSGLVSGRVVDLGGQPWPDPVILTIRPAELLNMVGPPVPPFQEIALSHGGDGFILSSRVGGRTCDWCLIEVFNDEAPENQLRIGHAQIFMQPDTDVNIDVVAAIGVATLGERLRVDGAIAASAMTRDTTTYLQGAAKIKERLDHEQRVQLWEDITSLLGFVSNGRQAHTAESASEAALAFANIGLLGAAGEDCLDTACVELLAFLLAVRASYATASSELAPFADAEIATLINSIETEARRTARHTVEFSSSEGTSGIHSQLTDARAIDDSTFDWYHNALALALRQNEEDAAGLPAEWSVPASPAFDATAWLGYLLEFERTRQMIVTEDGTSSFNVAPYSDGDRAFPATLLALPLEDAETRIAAFAQEVRNAQDIRTVAAGGSAIINILATVFTASKLLTAAGVVTGGVQSYEEGVTANVDQTLWLAHHDADAAWRANLVARAMGFHALVESLGKESVAPSLYDNRVAHGLELDRTKLPSTFAMPAPFPAQANVTIWVRGATFREGVPFPTIVTAHVVPTVTRWIQSPVEGTTSISRCEDMVGEGGQLTPRQLSLRLDPGADWTQVPIPFTAFHSGIGCDTLLFGHVEFTKLSYDVALLAGPQVIAKFSFEVCGGPSCGGPTYPEIYPQCTWQPCLASLSSSAPVAGSIPPQPLSAQLTLDAPIHNESVDVPFGTVRLTVGAVAHAGSRLGLALVNAEGNRIGWDDSIGKAVIGATGDSFGQGGARPTIVWTNPAPGTYNMTVTRLGGPMDGVEVALSTTLKNASDASIVTDLAGSDLVLAAGDKAVLSLAFAEGAGLAPLIAPKVTVEAPKLLGGNNTLEFLTPSSVELVDLEPSEGTSVNFVFAACQPDPCAEAAGVYEGRALITGQTPYGAALNVSVPFSILVDQSPPTTEIVVYDGPSVVRNGTLVVGPNTRFAVNATDEGSGVATIQVDNGTGPTPYSAPFNLGLPSRVVTLGAWAVDNAGNEATRTELRVVVDADAPTLSVNTTCADAGNQGWCLAAAVNYTAAADDAVAGLAEGSLACAMDSEAVNCTGVVVGEGFHTFVVGAADRVGNAALNATSVAIDSVPPTVTINTTCDAPGADGWCRSPSIGFVFSAQDETSGLAGLGCSLDAGPADCEGSVQGEGLHVLSAVAHDIAGWNASLEAAPRIDTVPPDLSLVADCLVPGDAGWCRVDEAAYTMTASDETSGLASGEPQCLVDGSEWACEGALGPGLHDLSLSAADVAGNVALANASLNLDGTAPDLSFLAVCDVPGANGWCRGRINASASAMDLVSGVSTLVCNLGGVIVECARAPATAPGRHTFEALARDIAGNAVNESLVLMVDPIAPEGYVVSPAISVGPFTVPWTASDEMSGLARIEVWQSALAGLDDAVFVCGQDFGGEGEMSGDCTLDPVAGAYCYSIVVVDVAGNEFTSSMPRPGAAAVGTPESYGSCTVKV